MLRIKFLVVLMSIVPLQVGCRPAVALLKSFRGGAKVARGLKGATKIAPKATPNFKPLLLPAVARLTPGIAASLKYGVQRSGQVGRTLANLKPKIPPYIYVRLYREWQENDKKLRANQTLLSNSGLNDLEQQRLIKESEQLMLRNNRIDEFARQYG